MPPSEPPRAQVEEVARAPLPSRYGEGLTAHAFRDLGDGAEHLALVKGAPGPGALVGSLRCDCGEQLRSALARIAASEAGVLVYVRGHEGRGIGLANKIAAYAHQDRGLDTVEANAALGFPPDGRDYAAAAAILRALGVDDLRLLSNNALKAEALRAHGLTVREELPLTHPANPHNAGYLAATACPAARTGRSPRRSAREPALSPRARRRPAACAGVRAPGPATGA